MEKTIATLKEGAAMSAGAIACAKWLDRDVFFQTSIAADPTFVNGMIYQHWGGIIAIGAAWGSTKGNNEWLKLLLIGASIYGILVEARQDFGMDTSQNPPQPRWGVMGPNEQALDKKLKEAAMRVKGADGLPVAGDQRLPMAWGVPGQYGAGVGFGIPADYSGGVGAWSM